MTDYQLRAILKDYSAENFDLYQQMLDEYPVRSRAIITKLSDARQRLKNYKASAACRKVIRSYANLQGYTDVHPFEVVNEISKITVEIRALDTKQTVFPKQFHAGGFVGHFSDNRNQEYEYTSNKENTVRRIRWSKAKGYWYDKYGNRFLMSVKPYKFHDYNF